MQDTEEWVHRKEQKNVSQKEVIASLSARSHTSLKSSLLYCESSPLLSKSLIFPLNNFHPSRWSEFRKYKKTDFIEKSISFNIFLKWDHWGKPLTSSCHLPRNPYCYWIGCSNLCYIKNIKMKALPNSDLLQQLIAFDVEKLALNIYNARWIRSLKKSLLIQQCSQRHFLTNSSHFAVASLFLKWPSKAEASPDVWFYQCC